MKSYFFRFWTIFFVLFVISLPFPYFLFPDLGELLRPVFEPIAKAVGRGIFGFDNEYVGYLASDTRGMYVLAFVLIFFSAICAFIWHRLSKAEVTENYRYWFFTVLRYYLALSLLKYGFDKIFFNQFYAPEPNILFTNLGNMSPDMLYWSSMGTSAKYSFFGGMMEIIPALFLLFRKTRLIGSLIAIGVMSNVLMINIGFDISVKLYSMFLLLVAIIIGLPDARRLFYFFTNKATEENPQEPRIKTKKQLLIYSAVKALVIGFMLFESMGAYFHYSKYDIAERPPEYLLGSWQANAQPIGWWSGDQYKNIAVDRIHFHSRGYCILETIHNEMLDFKMKYIEENGQLILTDYEDQQNNLVLTFENDDRFNLWGPFYQTYLYLSADRINLDSLPINQQNFHWTVEGAVEDFIE